MIVERGMKIDRDALLIKLGEIQADANNDLARMLEMLLLENQLLKTQVSSGLLRSIPMQLKEYPRFIEFIKEDALLKEL